ncbi:MAG: hypothetical protein RR676_09880 [Acinetobacter sp.]
MSAHCINIAISGISSKASDELKIELRQIIPNHFDINWVNISNKNIDLLLIHAKFFDTQGIQQLIKERKFLFLKISNEYRAVSSILENNTLFPPFQESKTLQKWIQSHLLNYISNKEPSDETSNTLPQKSDVSNTISLDSMLKLKNTYLHLFDNHGTLAIIDTFQEVVWLEPTRLQIKTNSSFNYELAKTEHFTFVSKKIEYNLKDWIWNLFWYSTEYQGLIIDENDYYKIDYWPQPSQKADQKMILQLSACFIQGAQLSQVMRRLKLPLKTVQQFISACIISNNGKIISAAESRYQYNDVSIATEQQGFLNKFFGKMRSRFGL